MADRPLPSVLDWVVLALMVLLTVVASTGLRRYWRGEIGFSQRAPSWWIYPDAIWRGYLRTMALAAIGLWLMLIIVAGGWIAGAEKLAPLDAIGARWFAALVLVLAGVLGVVFLLLATVVLFNWPKFVVPPYLRHQPGAVTEWRQAWRRRRHGAATGEPTRH
jgi:hypothetical protein